MTKLQTEARKTARKAGLRYVNDRMPGIYRYRNGKSFHYKNHKGEIVKDKSVIQRIEKLVLPPAWESVWISPHEDGHLQATGLDSRHRKQYRYHPEWNKHRNETKFHRMLEFASALPDIRERAQKDIQRKELDKPKVLGTLIRLMELSHIRVGNREYTRENGSYGLTTLRDKHVNIDGQFIEFEFIGKKGVHHKITLQDKRLANIVRKCRDIPGYELFQYYDKEGQRHPIHSEDINEYLKAISNADFTSKDFRTWAGTVAAFQALWETEPSETATGRKQQIVEIVKTISRQLGNTTAVCRKYYIHPALFEAFNDGKLKEFISACTAEKSGSGGLDFYECMLVKFLKEMEEK